MRLFYNVGLLLWAVFKIPTLLFRGKGSVLSAKLGVGLKFPSLKKHVIWIHSVSLGETKAARPLIAKLKAAYPESSIILSTGTDTGKGEGKKISELDFVFFLPLDLSWIVRKLVSQIKPSIFIMVESDFWLNLMSEIKRCGAKCVLVNGKMSQRSYLRLYRFRRFAKSLFGSVDLFCMQNELYRARFEALGLPKTKLVTTGNLKFDIFRPQLDLNGVSEFCKQLGLDRTKPTLVVSCTHPKEESLLLPQLKALWKRLGDVQVLLAPRHPARFEQVASLLKKAGVGFARFSKKESLGDQSLMLIDAIGVLDPCYQVADAVLMCGSFVTGVGGHNIFEPLEGGCALFFGPHMQTQEELVALVLDAKAGIQVTIEDVAQKIGDIFENKENRQGLIDAGLKLVAKMRGSTENCFKKIQKVVEA